MVAYAQDPTLVPMPAPGDDEWLYRLAVQLGPLTTVLGIGFWNLAKKGVPVVVKLDPEQELRITAALQAKKKREES